MLLRLTLAKFIFLIVHQRRLSLFLECCFIGWRYLFETCISRWYRDMWVRITTWLSFYCHIPILLIYVYSLAHIIICNSFAHHILSISALMKLNETKVWQRQLSKNGPRATAKANAVSRKQWAAWTQSLCRWLFYNWISPDVQRSLHISDIITEAP